jgi:hypothetical protein
MRSSTAALAVLLLAGVVGGAVVSLAAAKPKPPPPPPPPTGGASGTWTRTGDMITPRHTFSGALLADGRVLVAGGLLETQDRTGTERSELYDPATGRWSATGSLPTPVFGPTLTRLNDGRVLAAGGSQAGYVTVALRDAQLFDPAKGTWTATGSMREQRGFGHVAVQLADGRVLAVGSGYFAGAEVYDPRTGTWSSTGPMIKQHVSDPTATLLQDGRVLVAAGSGAPAAAELYDPATNAWSATGSLQTARSGHRAVPLADGGVLVFGGSAGWDKLASAETYDPATGSWTPVASMNVPRSGHGAVGLADGRVLVVAGDTNAGSAEIYDPGSDTWTPTGSMVVPRFAAPFTVRLLDGRVLAAGGGDGSDTALASAELFTP